MVRITEAGAQELKHAQRGLSVWQRRLLHALKTHERLDLALNSDSVLRRPQMASDVARLVELKLLVRYQLVIPVQGAGDDGGALAVSTRRHDRGAASKFGRRLLLMIGAGAICAAVVFAYLLVWPTNKVGKPPVSPVAASASYPTKIPSSPIEVLTPVASDVAELPVKPIDIPPPNSAGSSSSMPPLAPRAQAVPPDDAPKKRSAAPKEKPKVNAQVPPSPPVAMAKPDSPPEKQLATEEVTALAARTEPALRKSHPCPPPTYPAESLTLREEGTVELRFLIDLDGNVADSMIDSSSGSSRLDTAARDVLSRCRFVPGTVNGKPEPSWARLRYTWRLD